MSFHNVKALLIACLSSLSNQVTIGLAILFCLHSYINCEEECLRSKVLCYECNSRNEPYCKDPFNVSLDPNQMKICEGCCVKIVDKDTNIMRTCTSNLQINLFMVDHVCMQESGGKGHMCFCETEGCNAAPSPPLWTLFSSSCLLGINWSPLAHLLSLPLWLLTTLSTHLFSLAVS